jgi:hypothetical protein
MRGNQVSRSPILESFILGFFLVLVKLGLNLMIFRVSLYSINRLVNTEKYTRDFGE